MKKYFNCLATRVSLRAPHPPSPHCLNRQLRRKDDRRDEMSQLKPQLGCRRTRVHCPEPCQPSVLLSTIVKSLLPFLK